MVAGDCVSSSFLSNIAGIQNTELIGSPNPHSRLDSFTQKQVLENEFCKDFACCGLRLENLHQLLEHYEEYHLFRHSNTSGNNSDDEDRVQILLNSSSSRQRQITEDESLFSFSLTHLFNSRKAIKPPSKQHLTNEDLNMLENAQKYAYKQKVQTLDSIVDGSHTPSLSPNQDSSFREHYIDNDCFYQDRRSNTELSCSFSSSSSNAASDDIPDKPYKCHVPDCDKAYKNANGLKYHRLHGHCQVSDGYEIIDASKRYICPLGNCRKRYKNLNGLKYHMEHTHMTKVANLTSDMLFKNEMPIKIEQNFIEELPRGRKRSLSSVSSSQSM